MKKITLLLGAFLIFSCVPEATEILEITRETSQISFSIAEITFNSIESTTSKTRTSRSMTDEISWSHIYGGTGSIVFTNTINEQVTTVAVTFDADGTINVLDDAEADTGGNTITIENGIYDIVLSQTASGPTSYVPVSASITGQEIASDQTLSFTATTTYGLVLLEINEYLDVEITPTLSYEDEPTEMTANEGYYYVYVPASTGNVLTATESFYSQELTQAVEVVASETNAYYFQVTTFDQDLEVSLGDFDQNDNALEVLYPTGTPSETPSLSYGEQEWTVENADITSYRDGTPIPEVTDETEWASLVTGAWAFCNNDSTKGKLYNWYAIMGIHDAASLSDPSLRKEFAPEGFHVPTDTEWTTLENYLIANGYNYDGTTTENKIAKAMASTTGWVSSTELGAPGNDQSLNNSSGFNALPEGGRSSNGPFYGEGDRVPFWSSTEYNTNDSWGRMVDNSSDLYIAAGSKRLGFSVRFVRD
ncbi:fibrobacter succinogenes major paralogous domain-containing protein [Flavobacteriaceae bacterium]|nr:fibrobacter succinogenes major paralogous domain-containing protein [Flavobacteriaceae bacterium]